MKLPQYKVDKQRRITIKKDILELMKKSETENNLFYIFEEEYLVIAFDYRENEMVIGSATMDEKTRVNIPKDILREVSIFEYFVRDKRLYLKEAQ